MWVRAITWVGCVYPKFTAAITNPVLRNTNNVVPRKSVSNRLCDYRCAALAAMLRLGMTVSVYDMRTSRTIDINLQVERTGRAAHAL